MAQYKLGFIGGGVMASAIIAGVVAKGLVKGEDILVYDRNASKLDDLNKHFNIVASSSDNEVFSLCDKVIIAVKPNCFSAIDVKIKDNKPTIISIMAGVTIDSIEQKFKNLAIARVMPNTPLQVLSGMSAVCGNDLLSEKDLDEVVELFASSGEVVVVKESDMDVVCGLSGSGPAYMFMVLEALADGAVMMGLNRGIAYKLAAQTMKGAAEMMLQTGKNPAVLKDMVTSPGGTTIKGVYALEEGAIRSTMMKAVEASTLQSKKLGE